MANQASISIRGYQALLASFLVFVGYAASAQVPVDDDGNPITALGTTNPASDAESYATDIEPLGTAELETLVGPIALYPDDLLAIVLPASTYPLQIVQAARFLEDFKNDSSLNPDEDWDESIVALINYPDVVQLLNDDIDWAWQLGEAVISQQEDVIAAVESFRDRAYAAGNLKSDQHQTVSRDDGIIEIDPVEDDIIYVPYYEPERVVVQQSRPVYHYYANPYPVYYYPYPYGYTFGHSFASNYFWGVSTAFRIGWGNNLLHVRHPSYWGHPYYGHQYYGHHFYRHSSIFHHNNFYFHNVRRHSRNRYRDGDYWRPRRRSGSRQSFYYAHTRHYRDDTSVRRHRNRGATNHTTRHAPNRRTHRVNTPNQKQRRLAAPDRTTHHARPQIDRDTRQSNPTRDQLRRRSQRSSERTGHKKLRNDRRDTHRRQAPVRRQARGNATSRDSNRRNLTRRGNHEQVQYAVRNIAPREHQQRRAQPRSRNDSTRRQRSHSPARQVRREAPRQRQARQQAPVRASKNNARQQKRSNNRSRDHARNTR